MHMIYNKYKLLNQLLKISNVDVKNIYLKNCGFK